MANVRVSWAVSFANVPPTTPALDSFRVSVGVPGSLPVAEAIIPDLAVRDADFDVPNGTGYVASVNLVSADGSVSGPAPALSSPFDVSSLPVPIGVTVTFP
jgi:hypothetical protein